MSFSVILVKYRDGDVPEMPTAPLVRVLGEHGISELGPEYVETRDGLQIDLDTGSLRAPAVRELSLSFRHVSPGLFDLLYALAASEQLTLIVVGAETVPLILEEAMAEDLPDGFDAPPIVCRSVEDVARAVTEPFEAWRRWADSD